MRLIEDNSVVATAQEPVVDTTAEIVLGVLELGKVKGEDVAKVLA
jgi:hypothetical protein